MGTRFMSFEKLLTEQKTSCKCQQKLYAEIFQRIILREGEHWTGNLHTFLKYGAGKEHELTKDGTMLEVVKSPVNEKKYLGMQIARFYKFDTGFLWVAKGILCRKRRTAR